MLLKFRCACLYASAIAATFVATYNSPYPSTAFADSHKTGSATAPSGFKPAAKLKKCRNTKTLPAGNFDLHFAWDGLKVIPFLDPVNLSKRVGIAASDTTVVVDFSEFFGAEKAWACYQEIQRVAGSRLKALDATGYSNGGAALLDFAKKVCASGGEIRQATLIDYVPRLPQQFAEFFGWRPPPKPECIQTLTEHRQGAGWGLSGRPIAGADFSFKHDGDSHGSIVNTVADFNRAMADGERLRNQITANRKRGEAERRAADAAAAAKAAALPVLANASDLPEYMRESSLGLNLGGSSPGVAGGPAVPGTSPGGAPTTRPAGAGAQAADGKDLSKDGGVLIVPGGRKDLNSNAQVSVQNNQQIDEQVLPAMPYLLMPVATTTDVPSRSWVYYYHNGELMSVTSQDRSAGEAANVSVPMKREKGRHTFVSVPLGTNPSDVKLSKNRAAVTFQVN